MATTNPLMKQDNLEAWGDEPAHERLRIWLGILNGLFIGAAVILGAWGPEFYRLADLSVARPYNGLVMSSLLILFVCGLVGWLTAVGRKFWLTLLSWIAAAVILTILIANTATALQTTAIWLADRRFWGFSIYPATTAVPFVTYVFGGLFMML
ncbi:MAG: hypothetical protein KC443_16355, partial [Anaerolineales bacterium]|nr:hypothetical protein [Anaerolineales bacterium]